MKLHGADRVREMLSRVEDAAHAALAAMAAELADAAGVGSVSDGLSATVGSSDKAAVAQETGTTSLPPRPFLAPLAAERGEAVARGVGAQVAAVLRG